MADYFDFNYVTDPPDDEQVDERTQLNENWEKIDAGLHNMQQNNAVVVDPPVGLEVNRLDGSNVRRGVWNGSSWRYSTSTPLNWSGWSTLPLLGTIAERPTFTPKYRVNTVNRRVQLTGCVRFNAAAGAWPASLVQITANTGGISDAYKPVNGKSIQQTAVGATTTDGTIASAIITIESNAGNSVKISVAYQGVAGGGNFIVLDNLKWWF